MSNATASTIKYLGCGKIVEIKNYRAKAEYLQHPDDAELTNAWASGYGFAVGETVSIYHDERGCTGGTVFFVRKVISPFHRTDFHPNLSRVEATEQQIEEHLDVLNSLTPEQVKAVKALVVSATELGADRGWDAARTVGDA